ncbi:hypothetical protein ABTX62_06275 [Streptomyces sp. NPDC096046]|uniref:hypothetical protein n=1 Tax=Streptomyces sp. NPDC096046 TaxID=3155542 RepID=UPI00331EF324
MRWWRRSPGEVEPQLMAHVRATVWGPAEFVGFPPWWLVAEGVFVALSAVLGIVGTSVLGAWTGRPELTDGAVGLVCALALAVHLIVVRAGRALVGVVVVLAVSLAAQAPQAAAGVVLAEQGRVQSVVVTSVRDAGVERGGRGRYLCSVADQRGVPLTVRVWRGCGQATRPGDALAVVYDPRGRVPPRGVGSGVGVLGALLGLAGWVAALAAATVVAVVRSYRMTVPSTRRRDGPR